LFRSLSSRCSQNSLRGLRRRSGSHFWRLTHRLRRGAR